MDSKRCSFLLFVAATFFAFQPSSIAYTSGWYAYEVVTGDYNNDGRTDLFINRKESNNWLLVLTAQEDPAGSFAIAEVRTFKGENYWGSFTTLAGDVTGDNRTDLIWNTTGDSNRSYVGLTNREPNGDMLFLNLGSHPESVLWNDYQTLIGDVNGDGLADGIWNEKKQINKIYIALASHCGPKYLSVQVSPYYGWLHYKTLTGDVNGDGMVDIIWNETPADPSKRNRTYVGISQGDGLLSFPVFQDHPEQIDWSNYKTLAGDVDGDGLTDLIWNETLHTNRIYVALSNGDATFTCIPREESPYHGWRKYKTLTGDVNGDGLTDLIWNETVADKPNRVYVALSTGNGYEFLFFQDHPALIDWSECETLTGDVNADGLTDLIWVKDNAIAVGLAQQDGSFAFLEVQYF